MSSPQKQVHWDTMVKNYHTKPGSEAASTGWGSPSSSPSLSSTRSTQGSLSPSAKYQPSSSQGAYTPYIGTVPLPTELDEHIRHHSSRCLQSDLSLPSEHFKNGVAKYINLPACDPQLKGVTIVVDGKDIAISLKHGDMGYLSIGRVLGDLQSHLRQPVQVAASRQAEAFRKKREDTVGNVIRPGEHRSSEEVKMKEALQRAEKKIGVRNVDLLLGRTTFDGFSVLADGRWQLHLKSCRRYD